MVRSDDDVKVSFLTPDWPAPSRVRAVQTTRIGGESAPPYDGFNLGAHVDDDPDAVVRNRARLAWMLELPSSPVWLNQVHGTRVVDGASYDGHFGADASLTHQAGVVLAVLTADCLPVLFTDSGGEVVAAAHAGWRGLVSGVLEQTVAAMACAPEDLLVWLGPAIGPAAFEVGAEVRKAFIAANAQSESCFERSPRGRWLADLYGLARRRLDAIGVDAVYGGSGCTFTESCRFYSYRRDGRTGRQATLIWLG